jgi:hypothetical protein
MTFGKYANGALKREVRIVRMTAGGATWTDESRSSSSVSAHRHQRLPAHRHERYQVGRNVQLLLDVHPRLVPARLFAPRLAILLRLALADVLGSLVVPETGHLHQEKSSLPVLLEFLVLVPREIALANFLNWRNAKPAKKVYIKEINLDF